MAIASSKSMTLFEAIRWGTTEDVLQFLDELGLTQDDKWTDYNFLVLALKRRRRGIAKILIKRGCRVKKPPGPYAESTPLHFAIKLNDDEIVKMLLDRGASLTDLDENNETALHIARKKGNHDIVQLILSSDSISISNATNKDGFSHFHIACIKNNAKVVENFLSQGVNVNDSVNFDTKDWSGYTPLHFAVHYNAVDVAKILLKHNADITAKNGDDMTPLHLAVQKQNDVIADLILSSCKGFNTNPCDNNGLSHFHIACMKNNLSAVENFLQNGVNVNQAVLLNSQVWPGYTPLHFAVRGLSTNGTSQVRIIELLLRSKVNVHAKDTQEQTALHLACLQSDEKISKLVQEVVYSETDMDTEINIYDQLSKMIDQINQTQIVELLLQNRSDVNVKNLLDETPVFYLFKNDRSKIMNDVKRDAHLLKIILEKFNARRYEIFKILLKHGLNVKLYNEAKQTILHLIANINKRFDDDHKEELAELVISQGADVNTRNKYGSTPLHIAARNGHLKLIELLLKHNADINSSEGGDQSTPLHLATCHQQVKAMDILLNNKADVTAMKCNGMNVLHIMALINPETSEEPEFIESYNDIIATFIEKGCDIDAQDMNGRAPLHLASWDHNNAATWAFLQHFADVNIEDHAGETALSLPINNTERCVNIFCMFKDYVNMLKITGLYVTEKTDSCYTQLYGVFAPDPQDDFLVQCREEIEKMKCIMINNNISLHDILFMNANTMQIYVGNEMFQKILKSEDFKTNFDVYGNLLQAQFRKGFAKKKLLQKAIESLESMTKLGLPNSCSDNIFQYLSNDDLNNIIRAQNLEIPNKMIKKEDTSNEQSDSDSVQRALAYCKKLFDKQMEMDIT